MQEVLKCVFEDEIKIMGTLAWSFPDNKEFTAFMDQYGMQTLNLTSGILR
jgi:hypothetical protein